MTHRDNPAGRLFLAMQPAARGGGDARDALAVVWSNAFEIDESDRALLLKRLSLLLRLPAQIRTVVEAVPNIDTELALRHIPAFEAVLSAPLNNNREWLRTTIKDDSLEGLEWLSRSLSKELPQKTLSKEKVQELLEDVNAIIEKLEDDASLALDLRNALMRHLEALRNALEEFELVGMDALVVAVEAATGASILDNSMRTSHEAPAMHQFWTFLKKTAAAIAIANGVISSPLTAAQVLDLPASGDSVTVQIVVETPQTPALPAPSTERDEADREQDEAPSPAEMSEDDQSERLSNAKGGTSPP